MENKKWYENAVMVNRDPNWYGSIDDTSLETCRETVKYYFKDFGGNITDVMLCVFEQNTIVPSESFEWRGDKCFQKTENGEEVDYERKTHMLYNCYKKYGVDGVQIFIDLMREKGIRPWLSIRMNDVHKGGQPTDVHRTQMFYEEKEAGHMVGQPYGYYKSAYDFKYPRYRTALLGYMRELLEKYDIFGFELDIMREIYCFDYLNDTGIQEIMLDYIRSVRALVDAAAERVGHPVMLSIRTSRSPVDAYQFGFDIKTMVDEGLIDVVIPTPRWTACDSGIPIAEWKKLVGDKAAVIAGIETLNLKSTLNKPEYAKAYAAAYYAEGADGIYFNNHEYNTERNNACWNITRESCVEGTREFVVTFQDIAAYPENRYAPLPIELDGTAELALKIGKVKESDSVSVLIDFEGECAPSVSLGNTKGAVGTIAEHVTGRKIRDPEPLPVTEFSPYIYDIGGFDTEGDVTVSFEGKGTVHYIKIIIDAK